MRSRAGQRSAIPRNVPTSVRFVRSRRTPQLISNPTPPGDTIDSGSSMSGKIYELKSIIPPTESKAVRQDMSYRTQRRCRSRIRSPSEHQAVRWSCAQCQAAQRRSRSASPPAETRRSRRPSTLAPAPAICWRPKSVINFCLQTTQTRSSLHVCVRRNTSNIRCSSCSLT